MNILVTGGTGYIGSHTVVELLNENHKVTVVDNFSNSSEEILKCIEKITQKKVPFFNVDIRNHADLEKIFDICSFDCCIHFAGLKSVSESVHMPLEYYDNNVGGSMTLFEVMKRHDCKNLIFSSSATVYGNPSSVPVTENHPTGNCKNPYGWTKWMIEKILYDIYEADNDWNVVLLRYFNPIGAHPSGLIGDSPQGIPNNLLPYITRVAMGNLEKLHIFGNDYKTKDGTGVRDYIHVVDLAKGHVKALKEIRNKCGINAFNMGTGRGYSVLEVVKAFENVSGITIPYVYEVRRPGDIDICYSNPQKAIEQLGWKADLGIAEMCRDSWNWQKKNPDK